MSNTDNSPAVQTTTLYGQIPNLVIARPYYSIGSGASSFATSTDFAAGPQVALNGVISTLLALGYWATS
jgi:hypothetical protein